MNKVVSLIYQLSVNDEQGQKELVETVDKDHPIVFLYGLSGLPEQFEEELNGLEEGDAFNFSLDPEEGYGEFDPEAIVDLPLDIFAIDGSVDEEMLQEGNFIPMTDSEGNQMQSRVVAVNDKMVRMDFNHPLVGKHMHFNGQVIGIREASNEEIAHGHVHGEGGHQH